VVDGEGPLPDSNWEVAAYISVGMSVALLFGFVSGLDAQVEYFVSAPGDYLSSSNTDAERAVVFSDENVELMNSVSENSLGSDSIGSERGFCGGLRNNTVYDFRLADIIKESSRDSISFACADPFDVAVHSQPDGVKQVSEEDKDLRGEAQITYTCVQWAEISKSPVSAGVYGLSCYDAVNDFEEIPVLIQ